MIAKGRGVALGDDEIVAHVCEYTEQLNCTLYI